MSDVKEQKKTTAKKDVWDKYLVAVTRIGQVNEAGAMKGRTISVNIRELLRGNMPNSETLVNQLNAGQDHQNPHGNDSPMITWYFPAGRVKSGETYKANDVHAMIERENDETGEPEKVKSNRITGIKIHLDKKITGQDENGKPVFAEKE